MITDKEIRETYSEKIRKLTGKRVKVVYQFQNKMFDVWSNENVSLGLIVSGDAKIFVQHGFQIYPLDEVNSFIASKVQRGRWKNGNNNILYGNNRHSNSNNSI